MSPPRHCSRCWTWAWSRAPRCRSTRSTTWSPPECACSGRRKPHQPGPDKLTTLTAPNRWDNACHHTSRHLCPGLWCLGGLPSLHYLGGQSAAIADVMAVFLGPLTDRFQRLTVVARGAPGGFGG